MYTKRIGPPYSSGAVANRLIFLGVRDQKPIDQMKAQKLAFVAHGRCLCDFGEPLINEKVKAWQYGPVFPSLYRLLSGFGNQPIIRPIFVPMRDDFAVTKIHQEDARSLDLLNRVWASFGHLSGPQLSQLAHAKGSPWYEARRLNGIKDGEPSDLEISFPLISKYFANNFICIS